MAPFLQNSTAPLPQRNRFRQIPKMVIEMGIFRTLARASFPCARASGRMRPAIVSACTWPDFGGPASPREAGLPFGRPAPLAILHRSLRHRFSEGAAVTVTR